MYTVLRQLDDGQMVWVKRLDDLQQAKDLVEALSVYWPAIYTVRDSATGKEIEVKGKGLPFGDSNTKLNVQELRRTRSLFHGSQGCRDGGG
jgi:hypothetical protein